MGDPRRIKKKYATPRHPWRSDRIDAEKKILKEYGLKNKQEIWKTEHFLRGYRRLARQLLALETEQAQKEKKQIIEKLKRYNLVGEAATLEDVLALKMTSILERRLQTLAVRKGLANTMGQARQFIVHGHINIGDHKVTVPSYMVKKDEENNIKFTEDAPVEGLIKPASVVEKPAEVKAEEAE